VDFSHIERVSVEIGRAEIADRFSVIVFRSTVPGTVNGRLRPPSKRKARSALASIRRCDGA
jgi:hypothetical protein